MSNKDLIRQVKQQLDSIKTAHDLAQLKSSVLGKKSEIEQAIASLKDMSKDKRAQEGKALNQIKRELVELFDQAYDHLEQEQVSGVAPTDMSAPGIGGKRGHMHPNNLILRELYDVFSAMGYDIVDSGEIETDWYNFEVLNLPPEHPARDMQDTFYLKTEYDGRPLVVRTHTSGMQVRYLERHKPPVKIIVPGKVYRNEDEDATHSWSFYQCEGLVVGQGVSIANLKATLTTFVKAILGEESEIRLRPSFFPYTEPSVEVDVYYQGQWLELLGAGMVYPKVLDRAGIDSERYSGFAFGVGVERLAIVKYRYNDIRNNWRPNLYFLEKLV